MVAIWIRDDIAVCQIAMGFSGPAATQGTVSTLASSTRHCQHATVMTDPSTIQVRFETALRLSQAYRSYLLARTTPRINCGGVAWRVSAWDWCDGSVAVWVGVMSLRSFPC